MRFEDSPELFGGGCGHGTSRGFTCGWCGTEYPGDETGHDTVTVTDFGGKEVCEECFEVIEGEILARMGDILPWYRRILDAKKAGIAKLDEKLQEVETNDRA